MDKITKDMLIGDVMRMYPDSVKVFKKYFGKGCFTCPGANNEDVDFGANMHNADLDTVLKELNEIAKKTKTG